MKSKSQVELLSWLSVSGFTMLEVYGKSASSRASSDMLLARIWRVNTYAVSSLTLSPSYLKHFLKSIA